jgi:O-antigen biosynthesis protein WbqP
MYDRFGKRLFDLVLVAVAAIPALVLSLVCIVIIRIEDPGPAVFRQVRVGRNQRPFVLYKLRTMSLDTGDKASHEVSSAQVTPIGRILRKTKLDELPQLINVLRGEMSFVGPRPCLPSQTQLLAERAARGAFDIRPGITGPAQLAGIDMSTPVALAEADGAYVSAMSFGYDLRCIVRTALGQGSGDAVKNP